MIQNRFFPKIISSIAIITATITVLYPNQDYSLQEANKVLKAIEKLSREQFREDRDVLEKIMITESELNSYIAYRIETEKEEIMRELRFKLFPENRLEAKILIDLTGQKIPKFLRPRMTFYAGGKVEVQDRKVKLNIKELFLDGQPIQPLVLDLIIFIAAKLDNYEASSIKDWYELPFGIKNIETEKGKAIFYY